MGTGHKQFIVARGGSILGNSKVKGEPGGLMPAGTILNFGEPPLRTQKQVDEYMKSGHIQEYRAPSEEGQVIREGDLVEKAPGMETPVPLKGSDNREKESAIETGKAPTIDPRSGVKVMQSSGGPEINVTRPEIESDNRTQQPVAEKTSVDIEQPVHKPGPVVNNAGQATSKWTIDPTSLEGRDLEQLNVMILERDPNQSPFATVEEAKAHLSQDYRS